MPSVIETLKNAAMEMRQMHDFLAKLPTWECEGDCPTENYIAACSVAMGNIQTVLDKLKAWRDNASLMLKQAKPEDEQKWINQRRNYEALITLLEN